MNLMSFAPVIGGVSGLTDSFIDFGLGVAGSAIQYGFNNKSQKKQYRYNQALQRQQMMFDAYEAVKARQFASAQATTNYNRMLYLSNTAHQREVKDLREAGLNPILSATGGNGASTFNVATPTANQAHGSSASVGAMSASAPMVKSHLADSAASLVNALSNIERVKIENKLADAQVANVNSATRLTNIKAVREDFDSMYDEALKRFRIEKEVIGLKQARTNLEKSIYDLNRMAVDNDLYNTEFGRALKAQEMMSGSGASFDFSKGSGFGRFGKSGVSFSTDFISRGIVGALSNKTKHLYNYRPVGLPYDKNKGRSWRSIYHNDGWPKRVEVRPYKRK